MLFDVLCVIDTVRAGHPRFGTSLNLDGITRMLLHLKPDKPVDKSHLLNALALAGKALQQRRGDSLDAIAAYALTAQGYPSQAVISRDDGTLCGRDWTGTARNQLHTDMVIDPRGIHPAPWGPIAHAVMAARNAEGMMLAYGRPVSDEEFAELVRYDPVRQTNEPVVLLMDKDARNETLARIIADHTRARVWFPHGELQLTQVENGHQAPYLTAGSGSDPAGTWISVDPNPVPPSGLGPDTSAVLTQATLVDQMYNLLHSQQSPLSHEDIRTALDILEPMVPRHDKSAENRAPSLDELSEFARTFLALPTGTLPDEAIGELILAANEAQRMGRADSQTALLAHYLQTQEAYGNISQIIGTDRHTVVGRDWSLARVRTGWDLSTVAVRHHSANGSVPEIRESALAPWPADTFVYYSLTSKTGGEDGPEQYRIRTKKSTHWVTADVLAELIAHDPAHFANNAPSPDDAPRRILLLGPEDLDTARAVATATDRIVWSATGPTALHTDQTNGTTILRPVLVDDRPGGKLLGAWAVSPPGLPLASAKNFQVLYESNGTAHKVPDKHVITRPIIDPKTHKSFGRTSHSLTELVSRSRAYFRLPSQQSFYLDDPAYGGRRAVGSAATPWAKRKEGSELQEQPRMYVFAGHGNEFGQIWWLARVNGEVKRLYGSPRSAGEYLKRRPSLNSLRKQARAQGGDVHVLAMCCHAGMVPHGTLDAVAGGSPAQIMANETGTPVYAAHTSVGTYHSGKLQIAVEASGEFPRWVEYRPEPVTEALQALAAAMGLHTRPSTPLPPDTADTALRLIRALRLVFGPTAENDPTLVEGIGALERLRQANDSLTRPYPDHSPLPFTLPFLKYATEAARTEYHDAQRTAAEYHALLT
ncbi:lonely Cys domain-containing protein, partial [Streptomyces sp. AC627_RSS907]|uniref:lonely Cys domain-containing protein n=1 Tax=Streptomyces sp. AC627_RSS907 TaxID=2823684 RepID=UPI001C254EDF